MPEVSIIFVLSPYLLGTHFNYAVVEFNSLFLLHTQVHAHNFYVYPKSNLLYVLAPIFMISWQLHDKRILSIIKLSGT